MAKLSEKYNDSCIKIFEFLKLLYNDEATYEKVTKLLAVNYDEKMTTAVLLNKYLNTLKVFGIKIKKQNHKFHLLNSPFKIPFDKIDLQSIMLFKNSLNLLSDGKTKNNLEEFLFNLFIRFDENAKTYIENLDTNSYKDLSFFYTKFEAQIDLCKKYIKERQKVEITYQENNKPEVTITGIPVKLKYHRKKICYVIHSQKDGFNTEIPINKIINMKQSCQTVSHGLSTTVVYRLKGSLAKSYKLKEYEYLERKEDNGNIIIVNKGEDCDILISRLIRYNECCEIISPKFLKEKLIKTLDRMLSNYDD